MKEILDDIERWRSAGKRVAVARVVDIEGSGPRAPGAAMAVNEDGEVAGSVSGGCVETDVYENAMEVMRTGEPKLLSYGITDDLAWSVGLPCGGEIDVFVEAVE